jgi:hypothetical protein
MPKLIRINKTIWINPDFIQRVILPDNGACVVAIVMSDMRDHYLVELASAQKLIKAMTKEKS